MRSTLFYIPHEFLGLPLLGFGWLLILLVIGCISWTVLLSRSGASRDEIMAALPVWFVAAALAIFVLPQIETRLGGEPIGLPIRGYGVMVLLGLFSGIGITLRRAKQLGLTPDLIIGLGFWLMAGGVLGARIFYVVQKWPDFAVLPIGERIVAIVKLTEGGLVIYGGMIGGLISGVIYCRRVHQPPWAVADLITPGFLIGLAFGRIGCLLNGCCFGGVCTAELPAITFPQGSPPYVAQLENGKVLGLALTPSPHKSPRPEPSQIESVTPESVAATELHAKPGDSYVLNHVEPQPPRAGQDPARTPDLIADVTVEGQRQILMPSDLPRRSLPVHPSQIYSAIDAFLLCLLIYFIQPWIKRDGQAFLAGIALHGVARFTLELIRSDEAGQFGTSLTIAQWISIIGGSLALIALVASWRRPAQRAWNWAAVRTA